VKLKVQIDKELYKDIKTFHDNIIRHLLINIDESVIAKDLNKTDRWIVNYISILNIKIIINNNNLLEENIDKKT
jgi:hypothetical protein